MSDILVREPNQQKVRQFTFYLYLFLIRVLEQPKAWKMKTRKIANLLPILRCVYEKLKSNASQKDINQIHQRKSTCELGNFISFWESYDFINNDLNGKSWFLDDEHSNVSRVKFKFKYGSV